jgi:DNA-binding protein HU-beta
MAKAAKALTKSQITAVLAEKAEITKKQALTVLEALSELAYKNAKNTFTFPGVGKLVLVNRKARVGRNPATGAEIKIPAKKVVKFRVAKAAKDAILGSKSSDHFIGFSGRPLTGRLFYSRGSGALDPFRG